MKNALQILIVDDDEMIGKTLKDIFTVKGFSANVVHNGNDAIAALENNQYHLVLSDIKMPGLNGVELYREIKARQPNLPVVLMTAYATTSLIQEGLDEGVIAVLKKPLDLDLVLKFLDYLKRELSIVIVDDDPNFCKTLGDILQTREFNVHPINDPQDIQTKLTDKGLIVLLDMKLNGKTGLDVLYDIRQTYPNLPVILITGHKDETSIALQTALDIGAYTYFYKPLEIDKLLQTLVKIRHEEMGRMLRQKAD